jgi:hypothetical protein
MKHSRTLAEQPAAGTAQSAWRSSVMIRLCRASAAGVEAVQLST